ncbi:transcriptional regulator, LysR family [Shimia gijangensis]|uniref:Transcriptional regulator, LysR family n=2 Tax=Shimia gijangensis TaxID=1470563 RepID=A0A1M6GLN3_9RHOB|nr:transcriptional regulator, LysR family [Shimia gijangensis]
MLISRRFLPPLPWLSAFESVARLGSVTEAAAELDLTQGAVSRQIQKLEELLELQLFHRERRKLVVTPAGRTYASQIQASISAIANATLALKSNPDGGLLELAILPAFGTHWLAPRLPAFLAKHPGVTINLATRIVPFDFGHANFHAAIHYGKDDWPGTHSLKLMEEEVLPVISPDLCEGGDLTLQRLTQVPQMQLATRAGGWKLWFERQGLEDALAPGIEFDQFATMLKAAVFGAGAALMPRYLVENELADGSLITLKGAEMTGIGAYYLVWPESLDDHPPVVAFRHWISSFIDELAH